MNERCSTDRTAGTPDRAKRPNIKTEVLPMKKLLAMLLALGMMMSLAACGGQKDDTDTPDDGLCQGEGYQTLS